MQKDWLGGGGGGWNDQKLLSVAAIHLLESISVEGLKEEIGKGVSSVKNVTFTVPLKRSGIVLSSEVPCCSCSRGPPALKVIRLPPIIEALIDYSSILVADGTIGLVLS